MPAADAAFNKQEVDESQGAAGTARIVRCNDVGRSECLDEVATLRMRLEFEKVD